MTTDAPQPDSRPSFAARCARELKRLLVLAAVGGALLVAAKYYGFDRLDEEVRMRLEAQLREHYAGLEVSVKSARRIAGEGVEIRSIRIAEAGGEGAAVLLEIDEVFAECDTRLPDFLSKPPQVTAMNVRRPRLRAVRRPGGPWNLAQLLPLPPCQGSSQPVVTISDGSIEIVDPTQQPAGSWTLRNIELVLTPPTHMVPQHGGSWQIAGTLAGDHLERVEVSGQLDPDSGDWDVRGAVEGLEFSPRLRAALPRELSDSLAPLSSIRGRTQFGFHVEGSGFGAGGSASESNVQGPKSKVAAADLGPSTLDLGHSTPGTPATQNSFLRFLIQGQISEGRIDDARLPEPLTDVEATIRCDNAGVLIEDLSARCGAMHIELTATLAGYSGAGPMDLRLVARNVELDRLKVASLPEEVQTAWHRFSPRGTVDLRGRVAFDGCNWHPELTIECHDISLAYERFSYRLTEGSGTITVLPGSLSVRLRTIGGGQVVRCNAEIRDPGPDYSGWIDIQSEGAIPIDDRLLAAMDVSTQRIVRSFRPRGAASFQARLHRDAGEEYLHRHLRIQLRNCWIQHERFPYPIDKVGGSLELTDDTWVFRNLSGRNDSAYIAGEGSWSAASESPEDHTLKLQFTATDVPLAEELRQALPPGPRQLWSSLRPRGNIDHLVIALGYEQQSRDWSLEVNADKWPPQQNVEGRTISLEPVLFPYRLDNLTGSFRYRDGQMHFQRLQAIHGRAAIAAEGVCRMGSDGGCRLDLTRLSADRVAVDHELLAALPAGLGQYLSRFPVEGPLNLLGTVSMAVPPRNDAQPQLQWDLSLALVDGRVATATPVEHVHGGLRLAGRHGPEGLFCRGELEIDSAIVHGVQLTKINGLFWLDGRRLVFGTLAEHNAQGRPPRQITGRVFGGLLSLDGELALDAEGKFYVQPKLENADLAAIARELASGHRHLSGRVHATGNIWGSAQGKHTWRGDGQVRLRDADIYELPVMIAMLKLLTVQRPDRTAFTTSSIDFRIEGDDLALEKIDFSGDAISLKGKGRMNAQRQVDLKFYPMMGREERLLPIVRPLFGETGREFMLIEVTGTLDQPKVAQRVFPRIDAQLQQLFPELARDELREPDVPVLALPREALDRLRLLPRR